MEEKTYTFTESKGVGKETIIRVKESELTHPQKQLLLGGAIRRFNDLPADLQDKFFQYLMDEIKNYSPKSAE